MSTGTKTPYRRALVKAESLLTLLTPVCERIEIAGSLRHDQPVEGIVEERDLYVAVNHARHAQNAPLIRYHKPCNRVKAPWGWAIMRAGKDIENRSHCRFAGLRGEVVVHQSQRVSPAEYMEACEYIRRITGLIAPHYKEADHGCVLGTVEVVDFARHSRSPWFVGPYGLVLANPKPFERPIPARGQLGIWLWAPQESEKQHSI